MNKLEIKEKLTKEAAKSIVDIKTVEKDKFT